MFYTNTIFSGMLGFVAFYGEPFFMSVASEMFPVFKTNQKAKQTVAVTTEM